MEIVEGDYDGLVLIMSKLAGIALPFTSSSLIILLLLLLQLFIHPL